MALLTPELKFVDAKAYVATGYNLDKFVTAYTGKKNQKLPFCYNYLDSYEKLFETQLPPKDGFYNELKDKAITDEEYRSCEELWTSHNMTNLCSFLKLYNDTDTIIFQAAIINMTKFYLQT